MDSTIKLFFARQPAASATLAAGWRGQLIRSDRATLLKESYGRRVVDGGSKWLTFSTNGTQRTVECCFLDQADKVANESELKTFDRIWTILQTCAMETLRRKDRATTDDPGNPPTPRSPSIQGAGSR